MCCLAVLHVGNDQSGIGTSGSSEGWCFTKPFGSTTPLCRRLGLFGDILMILCSCCGTAQYSEFFKVGHVTFPGDWVG